jgi:predicted RNase H-like nuclease (RuvC/YqgF family)
MINFKEKVMEKDLTKLTKEELYNQIFRNYEDQVRILKDIIEGRDKFITMLEKQLENSDKHIERLYDEIGSKSSE